MIDAATIARLKETDLLALIGQDVALRHISGTRGGEWAGPCPFCNSGHRIHVQPAIGLWWCRFCYPDGKWQDAVSFAMKRDSVDFAEACRRLGAIPPHDAQPRRWTANEEPVPTAVWRTRAAAFVEECQAALWSEVGTRARAWLNGRGLQDGTLREWGIGFNGADRREDPKGWGLEDRQEPVWIPRGIVLPWMAMGDLWQVKIRRPAGEPRYIGIAGGHPLLFGADQLTGKADLLLTEGEFDAMLAWQEARDLVDVATLGSCNATPRGRTFPYLLPYRRLLVAYDVDQPGEEGAAKWSWTARATRIPPPLADGQGKDLTDFWRAGGDLRTWLAAVIFPTPDIVDGEEVYHL